MIEPTTMLAQAGDAAAAAAESASSLGVTSVWDFIVKGGLMMVPIGICSFIALTVVIERVISLRRRQVIPPDFLPGLRAVLTEHPGDREAALAFCRKSDTPIARVIAAGIRRLGHSTESVERAIAEAGERETLKLRKFVRVLAVIASVAPLMGLLGTIFGMIEAFQTVAVSGEALGKTEMLAGGIYEAMITTAGGLLVAIPVLILHHWITAKVDRLVMDMDHLTVDFIDEFVAEEPARAVDDDDDIRPPVKLAGAGGPLK